MGKDDETIWIISTLWERTSRIAHRNIVTYLPRARGEARTYQTPLSFF